MKPYYADDDVTLYLDTDAGCLAVLPALADASVDAVVTDPPYELAFMGKAWDASGIAFNVDLWRQCLRVLKPGGHLAAFGGTRTYHRMTVAIEDAGFEIRDSLHWLNGSGFPKSADVSKAIDKAAGAVREVVSASPFAGRKPHGTWTGEVYGEEPGHGEGPQLTAPATADAARWSGWGTALKPAHEPIALARKPLAGTVAANVLAHGTGALNIDGCRVESGQDYRDKCASVVGLDSNRNGDAYGEWTGVREDSAHTAGRWPTNVVLSHPPLLDDHGQPTGDACADGCVPGCPVSELDRQSGIRKAGERPANRAGVGFHGNGTGTSGEREVLDTGGASRFFPVFRYEPKAPAAERPRLDDGTAHTTVKPLGLMRWLVRLITPPGGTLLDPFAGSGTTLEAAVVEGFHATGIELDPAHAELCRTRLAKPIAPVLFGDTGYPT